MDDSLEKFAKWLVTLVLVGLSFALGVAIRGAVISDACLRAGYARSRQDIGGRGYCIAVINQTETVVPLADIKRQPAKSLDGR